ncbi:MAG TPA: sigma-70 factor domain-containing protein, partial [Gaiellaceae bacterium]|nr:sigma-70 factor domain-containing protein [Gaiellaceae bacterium]
MRLRTATTRLPAREIRPKGSPITTALQSPEFQTLLDEGDEHGFVDARELDALAEAHDLGDSDVEELTAALEEHGVEVRAPGEEPAPERASFDVGEPAAPADSLHLFLNQIGRYPLLTAPEEVALAKRIERGDVAAKERMINSNLRLVVS